MKLKHLLGIGLITFASFGSQAQQKEPYKVRDYSYTEGIVDSIVIKYNRSSTKTSSINKSTKEILRYNKKGKIVNKDTYFSKQIPYDMIKSNFSKENITQESFYLNGKPFRIKKQQGETFILCTNCEGKVFTYTHTLGEELIEPPMFLRGKNFNYIGPNYYKATKKEEKEAKKLKKEKEKEIRRLNNYPK